MQAEKYFTALFFIFLATAKPQTVFHHTFGDSLAESSFSAAQTADKGYILSGFTKSFSTTSDDYYLVKTDSLANVLWTKVYSGTDRDEAYAVLQTSDGGYMVAGYSRSFGALYYDACLIKTDANGDTLWTRSYGASGSQYANTIVHTHDGGYIFAGYTTSNTIDTAQGSIYLVKINAAGNMQWKKVLGPSAQVTDAYNIKQTTDRGFIITGFTNGYGEINGDAFLLKTDSSGNVSFVKTYGYKGFDWGNSVQQTSDGGYVIGGTYNADNAGLDMDAYIIKTDANGDTLWTHSYGGTGYDYGQSIMQTADGGYILGGYSNSFGNGNFDAFLLKVDAYGDTLFTKTFGGQNDDEANSVFQTADGGYAMVGQSNSFGKGDYDFYFIKTDAGGNSSCFQTNVHAAKKIPWCAVNTVITKQDTVTVNQIKGHPLVYTGGTPADACSAVNVDEVITNSGELKIFPNPGTELFVISTGEAQGNIIVTTILGETVYKAEKEKFPFTLHAESLPVGTYFVQVFGNGKNCNGKILVNK